jgi:hypothetical protein
VIYLDSVPNIYIGTEYLKKFYKKNIIDYKQTKYMKEIKFKKNNKLEIFCITPWQIEKVSSSIDHFHNAASFVEMPEQIVDNYIKHIKRLKTKDISLISYLDFDSNTTFNPIKLKNKFSKTLKIFYFDYVIKNLNLNNIYIVGKKLY